MWLFGILVLAILLHPFSLSQTTSPNPASNGKDLRVVTCGDSGEVTMYAVEKYKVKLAAQADDAYASGHSCEASLIEPSGAERPLLDAMEVSVLQGSGEDFFGNGNPSVILEGFSGGAHCCWTYVFADLGDSPLVLPAVENETAFRVFKDSKDGKYKVRTYDGVFDNFDGMCHACTRLPLVFLEIRNNKLRDVGPEFLAEYDEVITKARADVDHDQLTSFLRADSDAIKNGDFDDIRGDVLEIVFSYLYSGREAQAWQTLDQMWPENDRARIKKLILEKRQKGILSDLDRAPRSAAHEAATH